MDITTVNEIIKLLEDYRDGEPRMDAKGFSDYGPVTPPERGKDTPKGTLALLVGHSRVGDDGALAFDKTTTEWNYNRNLAHFITLYLNDHINVTIIDSYKGSSYAEAMDNLKMVVDPLNADLVLELHFNSFTNPTANGFEALHWHSSPKGKKAAQHLCNSIENAYPNNTNRGAKAILGRNERGARFLRTLQAPCVILEPFFGSNEKEWHMFKTTEGKQQLAKAIATGVNKCFSHQRK
jgi:N-acetylmuramoyl-L-alanine amidase